MEQNQLENFLILLLAMGSSLPIELISASSRIFDAEKTRREVSTESELLAALQDATLTEITLGNDIIMLSSININRREPLTFNLNNYKIASLAANCAIDLHAGKLTITGKGSIVANGNRAIGIRLHGAMTADNANYSTLIVDQEVILYAPESYGIQVAANGNAAYGVTVEFSGKIIARDGIGIQNAVTGSGKNAAKITISQQAEIEADHESGIAFGALGYGVWQIAGTQIAATGMQCRAGNITLQGTNLSATTNLVELISKQTLAKLEIMAGEFESGGELFANLPDDDVPIVIYGGHFHGQRSEQLSRFLAPGHHLDTDHQTGMSTVIGPQREPILDPVEKFIHEQEKLDALLARAEDYVEIIRSGEGLGEWQDVATKATTSVKRSITTIKKMLSEKSVVLEQVVKAQQRIQTAMQGIEKVEDDLRAEIFSVLAMAQELDPREYSEYSYNLLSDAMHASEENLDNPRSTLDQLYSSLCDLNLNLDLLEEPEETPDLNIKSILPEEPAIALPAQINPLPEVAVLEPVGPVMPKPELVAPESELIEPERPLLTSEPIIDEPSEDEILAWMDLGSSVILSTIDATIMELEATEAAMAETEEIIEPIKQPMSTEVILPEEPAIDSVASTALYEAHESLRVMLEAVQDLKLGDYRAEYVEQFGELQVAIVKARAILNKPNLTLPEILDTMDEMKFATTGLNLEEPTPAPTAQPVVEPVVSTPLVQNPVPVVTPPVGPDWSALKEIVAEIAKLEASDYTYESYHRMIATLERAKSLLANPAATQSEINDLVFDLNLTMLGLERNVQAPVSNQFYTTPDQNIATPNLFSSIAAGVSSGLTTYRKSRIITKRRKLLRKAESLSKLA